MRWIGIAAQLCLFWALLSGHFEPLLIGLGALSVALVCWLVHRADMTQLDAVALRFALRLPRYFLWLAKEVLVSSSVVVRTVWSPRSELRPVVASTPSEDLSVLSEVVYANSITLTPGTLALRLDDDEIEVHSLRRSDVDELDEGRMLRRVRQLESR